MDEQIDQGRMWQWFGYLQMGANCHPPAGPITKRDFLRACEVRKNVAVWRQVAMLRIPDLTAAQAAALGTRRQAFDRVVNACPFR